MLLDSQLIQLLSYSAIQLAYRIPALGGGINRLDPVCKQSLMLPVRPSFRRSRHTTDRIINMYSAFCTWRLVRGPTVAREQLRSSPDSARRNLRARCELVPDHYRDYTTGRFP